MCPQSEICNNLGLWLLGKTFSGFSLVLSPSAISAAVALVTDLLDDQDTLKEIKVCLNIANLKKFKKTFPSFETGEVLCFKCIFAQAPGSNLPTNNRNFLTRLCPHGAMFTYQDPNWKNQCSNGIVAYMLEGPKVPWNHFGLFQRCISDLTLPTCIRGEVRGNFSCPHGLTKEVPYEYIRLLVKYHLGTDYRAIALPCGKVNLIFILANDPQHFIMNDKKLQLMEYLMTPTLMDCYLPQIKLNKTTDLIPIFKEQGMNGMTSSLGHWTHDIRANIKFSSQLGLCIKPVLSPDIWLNRPFFFYTRHLKEATLQTCGFVCCDGLQL